MQLELGVTLSLPRGTPDLSTLIIDLENINRLEARMAEIGGATKETAAELMQAFNEGYSELTKAMAKISYEYNQALKNSNKRRGIVLIDIAPEKLKNKGLATSRSPGGSEDLRKAVLDTDEEYLKLLDVLYALEAAYEFLKGKAKSFENAYKTTSNIFYVHNNALGNSHHLRVGVEAPYAGNGVGGVVEWTGTGIGVPRYK